MARERKLLPEFRKALNCFETYSDFANAVGVSRQVVDYWLKIGHVPARYAVAVNAATNVPVNMLVLEAKREYERKMLVRQMARDKAAAEKWKGGVEETCEGGA